MQMFTKPFISNLNFFLPYNPNLPFLHTHLYHFPQLTEWDILNNAREIMLMNELNVLYEEHGLNF